MFFDDVVQAVASASSVALSVVRPYCPSCQENSNVTLVQLVEEKVSSLAGAEGKQSTRRLLQPTGTRSMQQAPVRLVRSIEGTTRSIDAAGVIDHRTNWARSKLEA